VSGYEPWARFDTVVRALLALLSAGEASADDMDDPLAGREREAMASLVARVHRAVDAVADTYDDAPGGDR